MILDSSLFQSVLDTTHDAIISVDKDQHVVNFNQGACHIFGYTPEEVLGQPLTMLLPEAARAVHHQQVSTFASAADQARQMDERREIHGQRKNGEIFPAEASISKVRVHGQWIFTAVLRDITERKQSEQRLAVEHTVATILATGTALSHVAPDILQSVCHLLGWHLGSLWQLDTETKLMRNVNLWHDDTADFSTFVDMTRAITFANGDCLVGRVLTKRQPVWIRNVATEPNFPRAAVAERVGLHTAFAFPITIGSTIHGVMEFYSDQVQDPDEGLLRVAEVLGSQMGQFFERMRAEEALRRSEERFRLAFEKGPLGIVFADKDGRLLKVNEAFCNMLNYTTEELERRSFLDITHPDDVKQSLDVMERIFKEVRHPLSLENRYVRKDGSIMWGHLTVSYFTPQDLSYFTPQDQGTLLVMGMVEDITRRKTSELHAKTQYAVARVLAQAATFEQAAEGTLQAICQTLDWAYGGLWQVDDLKGHLRCATTWSTQPDRFLSFESKTREITLTKGIGLPGRAWASGEPAWIRDLVEEQTFPRAPWANEAGLHGAFAFPIRLGETILGVMDFFSDQIQDPDEELLRVMETIGNQVGQFAQRKQLEAQIRQTQKMEAIGQLAGGIAHDFNNLLTAIFGYSELIGSDAPHGSNLRENVDQILIAAGRAKQLTKQILVFSRESGEDPKPVSLSPIIDETLSLLRVFLPATIKVHTAISSVRSQVMADATQLHQVIMNLCTNAEHTMRGKDGVLNIELDEVTIDNTLATQHAIAPGDYVRLRIADTGQGMPPEVVERIFEPFFTTKSLGEGTGMGLSVVHGIVKGYGGTITAESTVGQGTTMTMLLPAITPKTLEPHIPSSKTAFSGTEHILFIDDEKAVLKIYKRLLERSGYTVVTCESGIEAVELFRNSPQQFDLVVTDEMMPDITGSSLARTLLEIRPDLPIILCTGFSAVTSRADAKAIGIREYLMKPLTLYELTKAIRTVVDSSKSDGA